MRRTSGRCATGCASGRAGHQRNPGISSKTTGTTINQHAVHQARQPERQVPVEKRLARLVIAARVVADAEFVLQRRRKLARALQQGRAPVHLLRRVDQQVGQRRMQILARHEFDGRTDQREILRGFVLPEIDGAHRQRQRVQVEEKAAHRHPPA